jgi:hypothetical protein
VSSLLAAGGYPEHDGSIHARLGSLEVDHEPRIGEQIGEPVARSRRPGDEEAAVDVEHPDLHSTRLPGATTRRGDVDRRIIGKLVSNDVHRPDATARCAGVDTQRVCPP